MNKQRRLTSPRNFRDVRREGSSFSDRILVVVVRPNSMCVSRLGVSVGRRVGKAVIRNRVKRRLREVVKGVPISDGWDIVLIARKGVDMVGFYELSRSSKTLLGRAGVLVI